MKRRIVETGVIAACLSAPAFPAEAVTGKYRMDFYGLMKITSIYNSHGVAGDDYLAYVTSVDPKEGDFSMSARATRLGLNVADEEANAAAKIEIDFLGLTDSLSGTAGTSVSPRIRHAYMTYKTGDFSFLAGQTWQLTPFELPDTNNDLYFAYAGALWARAPQLRATWSQSPDWNVSVAAVRPTRKLTDAEGTASKIPQAQAQVQFKLGAAKITVGGALGQWESTGTFLPGNVRLIDLGFSVPYGIFTLNGQIWTGENLYDFQGGIGNMGYDGQEVKASGGFADLKIKPWDYLYFNAACGIDHPESKYLAVNSKMKNSIVMANVNYVLKKRITLSFETSYMVTEYKTAEGSENRGDQHYQFAITYPF
ncbi:MAG: hypothetical protein PHW69_08190 [Elusimicrobiaceae bacterium]|nr:hypothetical protein [Elusimicrobiaceae bacterium]